MKLTKEELIRLKEDDETANVVVRLYANTTGDSLLVAFVDFKQFPGFRLMYFFDQGDLCWKLLAV